MKCAYDEFIATAKEASFIHIKICNKNNPTILQFGILFIVRSKLSYDISVQHKEKNNFGLTINIKFSLFKEKRTSQRFQYHAGSRVQRL